jgi:hypothetical protein
MLRPAGSAGSGNTDFIDGHRRFITTKKRRMSMFSGRARTSREFGGLLVALTLALTLSGSEARAQSYQFLLKFGSSGSGDG